MNSSVENSTSKNILHSIAKTSMSHFGRQAFSILANLYLLKILNPQAMGEYIILQFLILQIPGFISIGLNMAMIKDGRALGIESQRSLFYFQFFISIVGAFLLWKSSDWIYGYYSNAEYIRNYLPLLLPLIPLLIFRFFLTSLWDMTLNFNKSASADLIDHILYLVISILATSYLPPLESLLVGFTCGKILSTIFLSWKFSNWRVFKPHFRWKEVKPYIRFGSAIQLGNICNLASEWVIPVVLGKISGPVSVGLVSWSMRIVWLPQSVTTYLNNISFVTFCKLSKGSMRYRWVLSNLSQSIVAFTGLYLLIINLFYSDILKFVVGEQWMGTQTMVLCFSIYVYFYSAATIAVQSIFANNGEYYLFRISLASFVARWSIGALFLYLDGARGYGFYYLLMNFYSFLVYKKAEKIAKFEWKKGILLPTVAAIATSILFIIYKTLHHLPSSLGKMTLEIIFVAAIFMTLNYYMWAKKSLFSLLLIYNENKKENIKMRKDSKLRKAS